MNKLAEDEGFKVENFDNYASHVEYGKQKNFIGGIGHLDVVPAGINWDNPPYGAVTVDGKLYARGAEDDKGPTMAFFYAMKILKEMDLKLSKRIKLVLSTDEESGWRDMDYYMAKNPETPFAAFIPDANFPVIYAEKGIANIRLCAKNEIPFVKSIYGGNRSNMVPDKATVTFAHEVPLSSAYIEKTLNKFLKDNSLVGAYDKEKDTVTIEGVSAHGSTPEKGINAVTKLFEFLSTFYIKNSTIDVINNYFLNDCLGKKIGYDYHDNEMGDLTSNLGVIKYENNEVSLELNIRYPKGTTAEGICDTINNVLGSSGFKASIVLDNKLKYVDPNGKLIKLLVGVYRKYSNDLESQPIVTGGGTFARLWENSVAFGPNFPGKESNIHNKNECIEIEDLIKTIAIYAESLYLLAK
jgi:succinyl-diaminopimelate desuccinylase